MSQNDFDAVIGLVGLKAAGKDELCSRLAASDYATFRLSDPIRAEAVRRGIPKYTPEQLQDIGDEGRRGGGTGYWARKALELARDQGKRKLIINGVRNPGEIETLNSVAGDRLILVGIVAPIMVRFARVAKRGQVEDRQELEAFLAMDDRDRGIGQPPDGQQVDACLAMVPWKNRYDNRGTLEEFHAWIDALRQFTESKTQPYTWKGEFGGGD